MKKLSLSLRIIICFLIIITGVGISAGVLSWFGNKKQLNEFFDTYQLLLARQLATANWHEIKKDTQKKTDKLVKNLLDDGDEDDDALGFAVFDNKGEMIFNDGENGKYFPYSKDASGFLDQRLNREHDKWRIVWIKSADGQFMIAVGQEVDFRDEAAFDMLIQSAAPWMSGLLLLMIASILLVRTEFKPLKQIARDILLKDPNDLSEIEGKDTPKEIEPLLNSINKLFAQIEDMIERERSFISDSAHELRSPLTALMVQLEVAMMNEQDDKTKKEALEKVGLGIKRANRLVEQLLALSRIESGNYYKKAEEAILDWKEMVNDVISEHSDKAKEKNMTIKYRHNGIMIDRGQPFLWTLLVRNLVENAIQYGAKDSDINIVMEDGTFSITNSNKFVEPEYLERLGERFFRPPGQTISGSGLGLSIVKRIAKIHDCTTKFENTDQGFMVTVFKN